MIIWRRVSTVTTGWGADRGEDERPASAEDLRLPRAVFWLRLLVSLIAVLMVLHTGSTANRSLLSVHHHARRRPGVLLIVSTVARDPATTSLTFVK